ncbi:Fe-S cluster assembly sulfur transfer protein SufU [Legionella oakridgensis]|uniref:SUF system FeS assembly protein, NifU family n=2 Tax=Legionella oakridgensis TaxID=29423 RepID=W0BGK4_9GAMM|nr:SUF system NifU family Fe-S cluster assembly protein [Legionella oakridgensis]AHE67821.1 SUF system FeS assembly protein, NifU family [Legionella oakridgensis ATCC 33761 = DSM 21215]KTD44066.1 nitrogen fixation protein NifU [Legionella oakridgensis]STY20834.1 nitrogen fixation protein NifU [Legionella longbeachae]
MMNLRELYQEIIIDHNRNPRNHHEMANPTCQAKGFNPLCGDKVTIYVQLKDNVIQDISFLGCGCAISQASASLMTDVLRGKSVEEAHELFRRFHHMVTIAEDPAPQSMDKLTVLAGVRAFPARVKCATLAWHTLESALKQEETTVTTE